MAELDTEGLFFTQERGAPPPETVQRGLDELCARLGIKFDGDDVKFDDDLLFPPSPGEKKCLYPPVCLESDSDSEDVHETLRQSAVASPVHLLEGEPIVIASGSVPVFVAPKVCDLGQKVARVQAKITDMFKAEKRGSSIQSHFQSSRISKDLHQSNEAKRLRPSAPTKVYSVKCDRQICVDGPLSDYFLVDSVSESSANGSISISIVPRQSKQKRLLISGFKNRKVIGEDRRVWSFRVVPSPEDKIHYAGTYDLVLNLAVGGAVETRSFVIEALSDHAKIESIDPSKLLSVVSFNKNGPAC